MTKRMLIDATHAEETRVVVLDGNRLEDFDVETSTKRQLKGNIYLAKVVRVEPSLQAAFVEYGGNRHGFLAFSEIHPDYYQIPVADRQRLLEMQAEDARLQDEEDDLELALIQGVDNTPAEPVPTPEAVTESWAIPGTPALSAGRAQNDADAGLAAAATTAAAAPPATSAEPWAIPSLPHLTAQPKPAPASRPAAQALAIEAEVVASAEFADSAEEDASGDDADVDDTEDSGSDESGSDESGSFGMRDDAIEVLPPPETIGGQEHEGGDDHRERRIPPRFLRNYKIQEVIRRRQIMLVQVVKEERGTKGAALTTYLSLAGRFGVLMPNSPRGGGISRKITSATDRRRLREVIAELEIPRGMGLIVRTAGANRPKPEIKRDCEYLLRLWDDIREQTMRSVAPALIYEEASLIKRAIRDVYSRDIDEILVDGEDGWRSAHEFMRMLMPSHAKKVNLWRDGGQPLFARNQVETQLDAMLMPIVQLRSGGYLVINQAEALVAIDVNSGRSTRERNIEETALRTNLEAADEVARQLRLRDLAGLIVIDYIDMESKRHNAMVERRLKEALKNDRARIQVGHISHFGLLEMSRQRLRPSLAETSFIACPHCGGTGHVRSTESSAIHVLRGVEDEGAKRRSAEIVVHVSTPVALYLLNHKRERLREIELRYTMRVIIAADDTQIAPQFRIDRVRTRSADEIPPIIVPDRPILVPSLVDVAEEEPDVVSSDDEDDDSDESDEDTSRAADGANGEDADQRRKRRRRRRRGGRRDDQPNGADTSDAQPDGSGDTWQQASPVDADNTPPPQVHDNEADRPETHVVAAEAVTEPAAVDPSAGATDPAPETAAADSSAADDEAAGRRRGRRGGRRRRRDNEGELSPFAVPGADQPDLPPVYAGPTPADPFGGQVFDIFDVMDRVERQAETPPRRATSRAKPVEPPVVEPAASAPAGLVASSETVPAATATDPAPEPAPMAAVEIVNTVNLVPQADVERPDGEPANGEPTTHVPADSADSPDALPDPTPVANIAHVEEVAASADPTPSSQQAPELPFGDTATAAAPEANGAMPSTVQHDHASAESSTAEEPPPAEPAVKPILIGMTSEAPLERKRGWWRR